MPVEQVLYNVKWMSFRPTSRKGDCPSQLAFAHVTSAEDMMCSLFSYHHYNHGQCREQELNKDNKILTLKRKLVKTEEACVSLEMVSNVHQRWHTRC